MASLSDVTAVMGEYMLKGWVLTDKQCSTAGCAVPLMRSPRGQTQEVWFCAKCNGAPGFPAQSASQASSVSNSTVTNKSTGFSVSRSSTPLTEPVENNEDEDEEFELPPESEESRRRREQSDRASAEIGSRLLRGWAMLGDECPNDSCFGIPLVRPPNKQDGEKDPRKECVVCGNVYLAQGIQSTSPAQPASESSPHAAPVTSRPEGRTEERVQKPDVYIPPNFAQQTKEPSPPQFPVRDNNFSSIQGSSALLALNTTDQVLQNTLHALSTRMTVLASSATMDSSAVGGVADAIGKVVQALGQVKSMQWSEAQAQNL